MKLKPNLLHKRRDRGERRAPSHLFGGRVRTSTLVLIVAFLALWWTYETYSPREEPRSTTPPSQVVPPGFVPDPNYTWVPRTRVQQPSTSVTPTQTPTPTTTPPPPTTTTTTTPLIQLPCIPPFCTPTSTPSPNPPPPAPLLPGLPAPGR
ncbi:hypothetical protein [Mycobacterium asiaticum]|uniref:Proline rich protein n=1 Tax=Mycobacterium asiaticum TaxID=1790 RepID=A0A1A3C4R1_MYCAS|nr:hypothetical protein [Mycobacterium asiaticum]OBI81608.1 hypothetical protein A9X01_23400 [Mycobacterium asiaticum]